MSRPPLSDHLVNLRAQLQALPIQPPPAPWTHKATFGIGGLIGVGYAEDSDLLLVHSSQGRGVFDCLVGTKIARDYDDENDTFDDIHLIAEGIGPLEGQPIRMAGLYGGGLANGTADGWHLFDMTLDWPVQSVFLELPFKSIYDSVENCVKLDDDGACELRAYGFSQTGKSFVIALSCDVAIFSRD
jgi:hypothetical protein